MRTRVKNYTIESSYGGFNNCIVLDGNVISSVDDIRLIVDETQRIVISSSMKKSGSVADGLVSIEPIMIETEVVGSILVINEDVCTLGADDHLTIEIDLGESASKLSNAAQETTPYGIEQSIGNVVELLNILNGEMSMSDEELIEYYQEHWEEIKQ